MAKVQRNTRWFTLKAQTEREERIKESLEARVRAEGLEHLFGRVVVPTEHVAEIRDRRKYVSKHKMYPGYIFIELVMDEDGRIPDASWFLVTETPGISGFVGTNQRHPESMPPEEIEYILSDMQAKREKPKPKVQFEEGERVRIREGAFENYDGVVEEVSTEKGLLKIQISIFGRSTSVELEYSKVEKV
jgi:transcriptional antiterminator NusG